MDSHSEFKSENPANIPRVLFHLLIVITPFKITTILISNTRINFAHIFKNLFYFWQHWVCIAMYRLSLGVVRRGYSLGSVWASL